MQAQWRGRWSRLPSPPGFQYMRYSAKSVQAALPDRPDGGQFWLHPQVAVTLTGSNEGQFVFEMAGWGGRIRTFDDGSKVPARRVPDHPGDCPQSPDSNTDWCQIGDGVDISGSLKGGGGWCQNWCRWCQLIGEAGGGARPGHDRQEVKAAKASKWGG